LALSNGVRELMVTLPGSDVGRAWQMGTYKGKEETHEIMNCIILYAVDRANLKYKGATHVVRAEPNAVEQQRKIKVARLEWAGNWNPEPAGWTRLAAIIKNQKQADVTTEQFKLGEGKLDAATHQLAHLTGTGRFTFTKEQVNELKKYLIKGGIVIADAAGGNGEFGAAAEKELAGLIGGAKWELIQSGDPILAAIKDPNAKAIEEPMVAPAAPKPQAGEDEVIGIKPSATTQGAATQAAATQASTQPTTRTVADETTRPAATQASTQPAETPVVMLDGQFPIDYRKFARERVGNNKILRLKGIKLRGKWAIILSAEDLSVGMVGQQVDGVYGYTPGVSTEIMRRLVLNMAAPLAATAQQ
jgi:hypothetical protein